MAECGTSATDVKQKVTMRWIHSIDSSDSMRIDIVTSSHHVIPIFDMRANHDGAPTIPTGGGGLRRRHPSLPRLNVSLWHIPERK